MAFDENEYRKSFYTPGKSDKYKKAYSGQSGQAFPYLPTSKLLEGVYKFRILPPAPEKNPEGFIRVAIHNISKTLGEPKKTKVSCIETSDDPCAVCDVMEAVAEDLGRMPPEIQNTLQTMAVNAVESAAGQVFCFGPKLVLAVTIYAEPVNPNDPKTKWQRSTKETGAMLEITAAAVWKQYDLIMAGDRFIDHETKGRYLALTKGKKTTDISIPPGSKPCPLDNPDLLKKYPHIVNAHLKNVQFLDYDQQNDFMETCWWFKQPEVQALLQANYYDNPGEDEVGPDDEDDLPWAK